MNFQEERERFVELENQARFMERRAFRNLGVRAISLTGWRWMPGMRTLDGNIVVRCTEEGLPIIMTTREIQSFGTTMQLEVLTGIANPDLRDPATVGCLLRIVRNIIGEPCWSPHGLIERGEVLWLADVPQRRERQTRYDTEAEAIIVRAEKFLREAGRERAVE